MYTVADEGDDTEVREVTQTIVRMKGLSFEGNTIKDGANVDMGNEYRETREAKELQGFYVRRNDFSGNSVARFGHSIGGTRTYRPSP